MIFVLPDFPYIYKKKNFTLPRLPNILQYIGCQPIQVAVSGKVHAKNTQYNTWRTGQKEEQNRIRFSALGFLQKITSTKSN